MSENLLVVSGVSYSYRRHVALTDASFSFGPGVVALLGPNGSGKTTLMRLISGSLRRQTGDISVMGTSVSDRLHRATYSRSLGWLPQHPATVAGLSVREYVTYAAWLHGLGPRTRRASVDVALERVRLTDRADERLAKLSGGMFRRAAIATAIVHEPHVVLLDEPTVGLDPAQRSSFREIVRELAQKACVLVSSHLTEDVEAMAEHVVVLDGGTIRFAGAIADFRSLVPPPSDGHQSSVEAAYLAVVGEE